MQNLLRNTAKAMLLACVVLLSLTGCNQSKLKVVVELGNKQCPISMGDAGEVTSITFDGKDVAYLMTMNESYVNIESMAQNTDIMKTAVSAMLKNPQGDIREMLLLVIQAKSGIKFIYKGMTSGKEASCYLNSDDLNLLLNDETSKEVGDQEKLTELVNMTNVSCPMKIDESTTLDNLTIEEDQVVYNYSIDEKILDIASLKGSEAELKENVKSSLNVSEPSLKMFLEACLKCNKGLGYSYTGDTSGEKIEFSFTVDEIKAFF